MEISFKINRGDCSVTGATASKASVSNTGYVLMIDGPLCHENIIWNMGRSMRLKLTGINLVLLLQLHPISGRTTHSRSHRATELC